MRRTGFDTMSPYKYPLYIALHPKDGFLELKANKKGSMLVTTIIIALWVLVELVYRAATDFDMNAFDAADRSLLRTCVITVIMYVMVCVSNWCFCTLLEGKGKLKDIFVVGSCALVPYIFTRFVTTLLSWVLAGDEQIFLTYSVIVVEIWCLFIAFAGLQEIHEYTFSKTLLSVVLTIVGLVIMLFFSLMLLTLFQQLYFFLMTLILELRF